MALLGKPNETDPKLLELLGRVKGYVMTKDERDTQRKSWVIGEMMLEHPEMSREEAEAIYGRVMGT